MYSVYKINYFPLKPYFKETTSAINWILFHLYSVYKINYFPLKPYFKETTSAINWHELPSAL